MFEKKGTTSAMHCAARLMSVTVNPVLAIMYFVENFRNMKNHKVVLNHIKQK